MGDETPIEDKRERKKLETTSRSIASSSSALHRHCLVQQTEEVAGGGGGMRKFLSLPQPAPGSSSGFPWRIRMESFSKSVNRKNGAAAALSSSFLQLPSPSLSPLLFRLHRTIYPLSSLLISPPLSSSTSPMFRYRKRGRVLFLFFSTSVENFHLSSFLLPPPSYCHKARKCGYETELPRKKSKMAAGMEEVQKLVWGIIRRRE